MKRFNTQLTLSALSLGLLSPAFVAISPAQALITEWGYTDIPLLTDPVGGTNVTDTPNGLPIDGNTITWGQNIGNGQSSLSVLGYEEMINTVVGPISSVTAGDFVDLITLTHTNVTVKSGTSITGITLNSTLFLQELAPGVGPVNSLAADFAFNFIETPNVLGSCTVGSVGVCDDVFVLDNISLGGIIIPVTGMDVLVLPLFPPFPNHDGVLYNLLVDLTSPDGLRSLNASECQAAIGSDGPCIGFTTKEPGVTDITFKGAIQIEKVQVPVPEPSTSAALVGAGLVSFGLLRKRKQSL
jgi:hypothetical protein